MFQIPEAQTPIILRQAASSLVKIYNLKQYLLVIHKIKLSADSRAVVQFEKGTKFAGLRKTIYFDKLTKIF